MTIKLDDLKSAGSCPPELEAFFVKAFPDGAPSLVAVGHHPDCRFPWRVWLAAHMPQLDRETELELFHGGNDADRIALGDLITGPDGQCDRELAELFVREFPNGAPHIRAVANHPDCRPEWRGLMAVYTPKCDRETGLELLGRSDEPGYRFGFMRAHFCGLAAVKARWCDRDTGLMLLEHSHNADCWSVRAAFEAHWCDDYVTALKLLAPIYRNDPITLRLLEARFAG